MNGLGLALWLLSAGTLVGTSRLAALVAVRGHGGSARGDRYWVFVGAASVQLGIVSVLTSAAGAFAPGPFLGVQSVLLGLVLWLYLRQRGRSADGACPAPGPHATFSIAAKLMLACTAAIVGVSLLEQIVSPVIGFDERMYNCSRVAYWVQHRSIFPFVTHNEGHTDMPFGAELFFAWGVLFTREELWAKIAIWTGFPAAVAGVYFVARAVGASRTAGIAASLLFAATPTVLHIAGTAQKQDIWTAALAVGTAWWVVRAARNAGPRACFMAGFFLLLTINAKTTSLLLLPLVCGVAVVAGQWRRIPGRLVAAGAGMAAGVVLSGFLVIAIHNYSQHGSPLGSRGLKQVAQPDMSARQVWTHTVRLPLFLFELPEQPVQSIRQGTIDAGNWVLRTLGADERLPGEIDNGWPGTFVVQAPPHANKYSLGGMLWGVMLLVGAGVAVRRLVSRWPRLNPAPVVWVLAMSGVYLAGMVYLLRWVNGTWERYWLGAYALGIAGAVPLAWLAVRRRPWRVAAAAILLAATVYPSVRVQLARVDRAVRFPPERERLEEPFEEVVPLMEPGSRILVVVNRHARDYPLFLPRQGFANEVYPWGRGEFDPARMESMIRANRITHILFERDDTVGFHWGGGLRTAPMVAWVQALEGFVEVPLQTPAMRLFRRSDVSTPSAVTLPAFLGFEAGSGLGRLEGPYPAAGLPVVRWGTGEATTLTFEGQDKPLVLRLECRRNNDVNQAITVLLNGQEIGRHAFGPAQKFETLEFPLPARAGRNEIRIEYTSTEGARKLAVLYRSIRVLAAPGG